MDRAPSAAAVPWTATPTARANRDVREVPSTTTALRPHATVTAARCVTATVLRPHVTVTAARVLRRETATAAGCGPATVRRREVAIETECGVTGADLPDHRSNVTDRHADRKDLANANGAGPKIGRCHRVHRDFAVRCTLTSGRLRRGCRVTSPDRLCSACGPSEASKPRIPNSSSS